MKKFALCFAIALLAISSVSAQPVIRKVIPESAAAGLGQLITVQGFGLALALNPVVNFQPTAGGATIHCSFPIPAASNDNELYLRLVVTGTGSCQLPVGSYLMSIQTSQGTSQTHSFAVTVNLASPMERFIQSSAGTQITQAKSGDLIRVFGYGIDLANAKVVFSQGANVVIVNGTGNVGLAGVAAAATIPAGFTPGPILVQLRGVIGTTNGSPDSNALKLTLVP
jgi:IPT/TIG domain